MIGYYGWQRLVFWHLAMAAMWTMRARAALGGWEPR